MHKENRIHETSQEPVQRHPESQREWRQECLLTWPLLWMKAALSILRGFFFFFKFYWGIIYLPCCVSLRCIARWYRCYIYNIYMLHIQIYIYIHSLFFRIFSHVSFFVCLCVLSCVWLLCGPLDYRPSGSSVPGISQARILEWAAISFSRGSS